MPGKNANKKLKRKQSIPPSQSSFKVPPPLPEAPLPATPPGASPPQFEIGTDHDSSFQRSPFVAKMV